MKRKLGLQRELTLSFTLISVFIMSVTGLISYFFASNQVHDLTVSNLNSQINSIAAAIDITLKDGLERENNTMDYWAPVTVPTLLSVKGLFSKSGSIQESHEIVDKVAKETGGAATVFANTTQGFMRVSTSLKGKEGNRLLGTLLPANAPQTLALAQGKRYVGRAKVLNEPFLTVYEPILKDGQVIGAFFIGHKDQSEKYIKEYLKKQKLLQTGYFYILDSEGKFILHPTKEGENSLELKDLDGRSIFKELISMKSGMIQYRWLNAETNQSQKKIAIFNFFEKYDWYVTASLNMAEIEAPVNRLGSLLFGVAVLMTGLMILVTFLYGRGLVKKLTRVEKNLADSSNQVIVTSTKLAGASDSLAQASTDQAASLQETVSAMEEISSMVLRNSENTQITAEQSVQMDQDAKKGGEILGKLSRHLNESEVINTQLKVEMAQSNREVEQIINLISVISDKTQVINDIVFQTKLLSFNASVEAARAGDHGKGFSVVAEEVGRLAAMSGSAAQEINDNLDVSKKKIESIIASVQKKTDALITKSAAQNHECLVVSNECQNVFESLLQRMAKVNVSITEISSASQEQNQGIAEVKKAIEQLDQLTQKNSTTASDIRDLSGGLEHSSNQMRESVIDLTTLVQGGAAKTSAMNRE